ncbi:hypothetical protein D3C72_1677050 [compost metagenome]
MALAVAATALAISRTGCARRKVQVPRPGLSSIGENASCTVWLSSATSAMAIDGATADEPRMMSTLSSVTKRRATLAPCVGSEASSSTM